MYKTVQFQVVQGPHGGPSSHTAPPPPLPPNFSWAVNGGHYSLDPLPHHIALKLPFFSFCDCNKSTLQKAILDSFYAFMGVTAVVFLSLVSMETII